MRKSASVIVGLAFLLTLIPPAEEQHVHKQVDHCIGGGLKCYTEEICDDQYRVINGEHFELPEHYPQPIRPRKPEL